MAVSQNVAVIIPCFNEAKSIAFVIQGLKKSLPNAEIFVFDNNSKDDTVAIASKCGVTVQQVRQRGKGHVVRSMFRDVYADYYIMIDGDDTYPVDNAAEMLNVMTTSKTDMLIGNRLPNYRTSKSRRGHFVGNLILTRTVNYLFNSEFKDLLSGYRILSRRFVKSMPLFSRGFEVETDLSIHAIEVDAKILEIAIDYKPRIPGTESKLNALRDGIRIVLTIFFLFKDFKPKIVYASIGIIFAISGLVIGIPVIIEFLEIGLVPRFPSAILASALMILSFLTGFTGLILSGISKNRRIIKKLAFLSIK